MRSRGGTWIWILAVGAGLRLVEGLNRTYCIGVREVVWDYAPSGTNLVSGRPVTTDEHASVFLSQGPHRIGRRYKKVVYLQYTDESYTKEIAKPSWLGFLGPVLKAEVGDSIIIHLKNFASRPYSLHPHGVFYDKLSEGAFYPDKTSERLKLDDAVPPGGTHTYTWTVKPEYAPTKGDANCLTWIYHSHGDAPRDIYSGLIGALLTCKKGSYSTDLRRTDVDKDFILMFSVIDENQSWYQEENIQSYCTDPAGVDPNDPDFKESNKMHVINGYMFGNLPGIELCLNRTVAWHLFGMGSEVDVHSVHFHGQTLLDRGHRVDVLSLFAASFITANMVPMNTGTWLLACQVNDHLIAGMEALFQVSSCGVRNVSGSAAPPQVRQYFIAAEKVLWNYTPSGLDVSNNVSLTKNGSQSELYFGKSGGRLGGKYWKVQYVAYTDDTFTQKKKRTGAEVHLGILGPVMKMEVGDILQVSFLNKANRNYSIQAHGLQYKKQYEGATYQDGNVKKGSQVPPGEKFVYRWQVTDGPSVNDPPCLSYLYYSSSEAEKDTNSGLFGPLLVCRRGTLNTEVRNRATEREFFLLFSVLDENLSWYLNDNIKTYGNKESDVNNEDFQMSNKMHAVNGFMYGNLPGLDMCKGDRVVWHLLGLGTEVDIHGIYFEGNTFQLEGLTRDTLTVFPHTMATVTMQPDSAGVFEVNCRVFDHYSSGMRHQYSVRKCEAERKPQTSFAKVVQYFISAEELEWDFSPSRAWELEKHNTTAENSQGNIYVGKGENRIGSKYKKVVYREYTDATFSTRKARPSVEKHLEIMGPIIRAEVGEKILVTFKNQASRPYSVHAHSVQTNNMHKAAQPGEIMLYEWNVPERSGPGDSDPNCIPFTYYSDVELEKDIISGLVGPLVICRKGVLNIARRRNDVDREFALLFLIFDENKSWYLKDNVRNYLNNVYVPDDGFVESNRMEFGKNILVMMEGETVVWYLLGLGNEIDIHTVHFHGETFIYKAHRADVYELFPGTFQAVEMVVRNPGTWLMHCHLADHIHAGMETTYTIKRNAGTSSHLWSFHWGCCCHYLSDIISLFFIIN
uniref:ferroxidase n=1 Tax=Denticeps clupeoides TaxID=299321 RepID=A0AAY4A9Z6_9TELE